MKISFVVPAYNEEKVLGKCLEAIMAELGRHPELTLGQDAEVVVVNNASTDKTGEVARSFAGVQVIDEPRKGLVQARKSGFDSTTGELVANVDSDTIVPEGWLNTVLHNFEHDPKLVALSGPYIYYDLSAFSRGLVHLFYFFGYILGLLRLIAMLQGGNFVIKRDAWAQVGGFDTNIAFYGEDTDVAKRLQRVGRVRWTWSLPALTSGRRIAQEGIVVMSLRYTINNLWMYWCNKPFSKQYKDIRPN
ncbi:MAG: hypothetical protein JWO43_65 [Candidatus Adlerbacteria bacterium]|nr:hypothetical protein [Candidatus Adlerbacteria bacterium]